MPSLRYRAARPHLIRALIGMVVAGVGCGWARAFGQIKWQGPPPDPATTTEKLIAVAGAAVVVVAGAVAVRALAAAVRAAFDDDSAQGRGTSLAFVVAAIGYLFVVVTVLGALDIKVEKILLGGALTGVVLGIAAQQSLGNFFAGIVLLITRPFSIGEYVVLRSGPIGGEYEGVVTEMTLLYVHMQTKRGPLQLPNAGVLAAAIGPGARSVEAEEEDAGEADPGTAQGGTAAG